MSLAGGHRGRVTVNSDTAEDRRAVTVTPETGAGSVFFTVTPASAVTSSLVKVGAGGLAFEAAADWAIAGDAPSKAARTGAQMRCPARVQNACMTSSLGSLVAVMKRLLNRSGRVGRGAT